MNRGSIFMLATVAALGLALLPSNLNSQQSTLKETNGIAEKIANSILVGTARASKAGHGALAACPSCNSFAAFDCTATVLP